MHKEANKLKSYQIFISDVDGLIVGSPVRFMGVQIGYVKRVKILPNEVYLKFVITSKDVSLPKGVIATVEFNGMGGSKSLELYPPTKESIASGKIVEVGRPVRLHDSAVLLGDMYNKIDSIIKRTTVFAKETVVIDEGVDIDAMEDNIKSVNRIMKKIKER